MTIITHHSMHLIHAETLSGDDCSLYQGETKDITRHFPQYIGFS